MLQSAMTIGDSVLFWLSAQAGMAALRETIALLLNERGMTKSTYRRCGIIVRGGPYMKSPRQNRTVGMLTMNLALGLFARTVCTILVYAAVIWAAVLPRVTSFVPSINMTMSAGVFLIQVAM